MYMSFYSFFKKMAFLFITAFFVVFLSGYAFAERLSISSNIGNVRSGPGTKYAVIWKVEKYYPLSVIKKTGAWYNFRDFEGDEGWVHKSIVNNKKSVITKKGKCDDKCNVRSGPGVGHEIVYSVESGVPFLVIKRKGKWIRIQHADGDKGWIYDSLVW